MRAGVLAALAMALAGCAAHLALLDAAFIVRQRAQARIGQRHGHHLLDGAGHAVCHLVAVQRLAQGGHYPRRGGVMVEHPVIDAANGLAIAVAAYHDDDAPDVARGLAAGRNDQAAVARLAPRAGGRITLGRHSGARK